MSMRLVQPPDFQAALFCHTELSWIVEHRAALLIFGGGWSQWCSGAVVLLAGLGGLCEKPGIKPKLAA